MVPPEAFSTAAAQSSKAFCKGCDAGTQCEIFRSKVLSCANAGVALNASANANTVFLIDIVSLVALGFDGPLQILLYDIIIIASRRHRPRLRLKPITPEGASIADESSNHRRGSGRIVAWATASHLWHRQHHPGAADPGIRARPHPRRPLGRRYRG